jgi:hypothetical protein
MAQHLLKLRYEEWHVRVNNQSILHTLNDLSKMVGFIEVPRLISPMVFPYTWQVPHVAAFRAMAAIPN